MLAGYVIEYQARENFIQSRLTDEARAASDRLLERILPGAVAEELKSHGHVEPSFYDSVSVLFTDFVGFTLASEKMRPRDLVEELDGYFTQFDAIAGRNGLEKLKTIGDAYMCAGGLPALRATHAIDTCLAALELRSFIRRTYESRQTSGTDAFRVRIGIHTGPVTAGVIGIRKFAYDIWGDTVNTASRMESTSEPDRINISAATHELVKPYSDCTARGALEVKGKAPMEMFFLNRILPEYATDEQGLVPNTRLRRILEDGR